MAPDAHGSIPQALQSLPNVVVVCGHYGVGKTNFSLNLAIDLSALGRQVCLVDLDVVNPYFRSSDYPQLLAASGVDLLAPQFAGTALDAPMLSGRIATELCAAWEAPQRTVIVDVGGDDAGATALGSFSAEVAAGPYAMLYVVNAFRELTQKASDAVAMLPGIQAQSRCRATGIVNNSHLQRETCATHIERGLAFAREVAQQAHLPLTCTTCPARLEDAIDLGALGCDSVYMMQEYVLTPWDA